MIGPLLKTPVSKERAVISLYLWHFIPVWCVQYIWSYRNVVWPTLPWLWVPLPLWKMIKQLCIMETNKQSYKRCRQRNNWNGSVKWRGKIWTRYHVYCITVEPRLTTTSLLRPLFFVPTKRPVIFLSENPVNATNDHFLKSQRAFPL